MYNKIASIILNSAKASGLSDVFVAQPDAVKENLAGKIFLLAEIGGRKSEGRKIFDFLILSLTDNYYNDEKIIFRDKIEGLKLENIFEAAIAKTNKNLTDFLADEKIRINPETTSLTLGVIYENKLHFTNFGRNRALLIYRHGENYELINVEANAAEAAEESGGSEAIQSPQLFSSVISGEVPASSYFIFASEALPEYLSGQEMISIVTKLPPMTAAEQIKNVLTKINTYVPFLGIIIKNTAGLPQAELRDDLAENSSAHSSISSLNYTEQKTEQMLAPAGLINFSKVFKKAKRFVSGWLIPPVSSGRGDSFKHRKDHPEASRERGTKDAASPPPVDLGTVKSMNTARSDSFLIKEKIFFKKKSGWLANSLTKIGRSFINWFDPRRWPQLVKSLHSWFRSLNFQNRLLFGALGLLVIGLVASTVYTSWNREREAKRQEFQALLSALEEKEALIESRLLYNDEAGAGRALLEAQSLLDSFPRDSQEQQSGYESAAERLRSSEDKVQRIIRVGQASQVNDLSGLNVQNLTFAKGRLLAGSPDTVYEITPNSSSSTITSIAGATSLSDPFFDGDLVHFRDGERVVRFNPVTKSTTFRAFSDPSRLTELASFKIYGSNDNFYSLHKPSNQILRYNWTGNTYGAPADWLSEDVDLSRAADLAVDGDIYVLNNDGQVLKFRLNKSLDYGSAPILPLINGADRLIAGATHLYFFDAGSKRLIVLEKSSGSLLNQYQLESLSQPVDFAVDETGQKAFFLDDEAVYEITLNQ